jgi:hypothetical protein
MFKSIKSIATVDESEVDILQFSNGPRDVIKNDGYGPKIPVDQRYAKWVPDDRNAVDKSEGPETADGPY